MSQPCMCVFFFLQTCSMLLTWRTRLRKFLAKKRKGDAEQRDPEIK